MSAPLHKAVDVLLERRVVADVLQRDVDLVLAFAVLSGTAGHRAGGGARLYAAVIAQPAHPLAGNLPPEAIVDPLERPHQRRPRGNWGVLERLYRRGPPPGVGLGVWADCRTGEADRPVIGHEGPELVTRLPLDLVLLNTVVELLPLEGDAVGGAG